MHLKAIVVRPLQQKSVSLCPLQTRGPELGTRQQQLAERARLASLSHQKLQAASRYYGCCSFQLVITNKERTIVVCMRENVLHWMIELHLSGTFARNVRL